VASRTLRFGLGTALALLVVLSAAAAGPPELKIGVYSQSFGPSRAGAGARITAITHQPGRAPHHRPTSTGRRTQPATSNSWTSRRRPVPSYPTLPETAPLLQSPTPRGPQTFWYPDGGGHSCVYVPNSSSLCYTITGPTGSGVQPALDPHRLAASVSTQIDLSVGGLKVSPSSSGLTGAASWFWLEPGPSRHTETAQLAGETVTVDATPTIEWQFGDGTTLNGGAGEPYRPGPPPDDAIVHSYETRCLPGDQGRNPQVLPSCGTRGYQVDATVSWSFSYRASGAIDQSGTLPTRTTEATTNYAVTEVRAFLTGNSG
jgi:hypothetical protein